MQSTLLMMTNVNQLEMLPTAVPGQPGGQIRAHLVPGMYKISPFRHKFRARERAVRDNLGCPSCSKLTNAGQISRHGHRRRCFKTAAATNKCSVSI